MTTPSSTRRLRALLAVLAVLVAPGFALAADSLCQERGTPPADLVEKARASGAEFARYQPLAVRGTVDVTPYKIAVAKGSVLRVDAGAFAALRQDAPKSATLALPSAGGATVELELVRVEVTTPDFKMVTSDSRGEAVPYTPGLHYRGVVKGVRGSLAAVSVFADEVFGIYRTGTETVVIGRLAGDNQPNDHLLYKEADLLGAKAFECGSRDDVLRDGSHSDPKEFEEFQAFQWESPVETEVILARCVRIYVEADFDIFQNKGSAANVTNYITAVFNQSATLYANDSVPISLSQVFVWTSTSPYTSNSSSGLLSQFQQFRNSFNGDLGHLVAFRGGGGIAAGFNGFCNSNIDNRQCFSGIQSTYQNVPTYSWTVEVFTHEMGHLMGSRHTHACVWNGNNTAIDGCAAPEGTCARPGIPSAGGTIMSYCHQQSVGIRFPNGFGPQPGNVIRNRFANASCLTDCGGNPPPPPTCTTYTGSLSGTGASAVQPNGTWYQTTASGIHAGTLTGPGGADFDLYLRRWNGSAWVTVAASEGPTSSESISFNGSAGYYYWRILSFSGSGSYSLCFSRP
jgi:hypothetical protein